MCTVNGESLCPTTTEGDVISRKELPAFLYLSKATKDKLRTSYHDTGMEVKIATIS